MATLVNDSFAGYSSTLQTNGTWARVGSNDANADGTDVDIPGNGERTYRDGVTPGSADGSAQATFASGGNGYFGPMARVVDATNLYWAPYSHVSGAYEFWEGNGGAPALVSSTSAAGQPATKGIRIVMNTDQTGAVWADTGSGYTSRHTFTGTRTGTAGQYGFQAQSVSGGSLDNYLSQDNASSGSTGTLATTNAADTSAAAGTTTILGTLARTNAADTSAAAGTTTVRGSLATTNANDTLAASGPVGQVTGSLSTTNANDTLAAAGNVGILGALAASNANDTLAAAGNVPASGTIAYTNANDSLAASGKTSILGTLATTNANDTLSAQGTAGLEQGGGGGKKRKPFKSWDQRQREREAEIKAHQDAVAARLARETKDKYGDLPPALAKTLAASASPKNKPLSAHQMKEYERVRAPLHNDDEEAFALILGAL